MRPNLHTMHIPDDCNDIDWSATTENEPAEEHVRAPRKPKVAARPFKRKGMRPAQRKAIYGGKR
jgi:hypothetical protein